MTHVTAGVVNKTLAWLRNGQHYNAKCRATILELKSRERLGRDKHFYPEGYREAEKKGGKQNSLSIDTFFFCSRAIDQNASRDRISPSLTEGFRGYTLGDIPQFSNFKSNNKHSAFKI